MAQSGQSPYEKAKNTCNRRGSSVDELKFTLRKKFKNRLRDLRSKSVDSGRSLTDDINEGYRELLQNLQINSNNHVFIEPEDAMRILREIQQELLDQITDEQITDYEKSVQNEMNSIVENLITCRICEEYSEEDICTNCQKHFAD